MRSNQNLNRRLRVRADDGSGEIDGDGTEEPDGLDIPSWVPDGRVSQRERWWTAIRADPGRSGGITLAVIAAIAVLVTLFTLVDDRPAPIASAKLPPVEMVSSAAPRAGATASQQSDKPVVVSVVGLVHQPGLVTLAPDSRVADAVIAAGGALDGADTIGLNLAGHVSDGQQIVVGVVTPAGQPAALGSSVRPPSSGDGDPGSVANGPKASGPVDLNTASVEELDALPGVGPVTAAAIVSWRESNGRFSTVEELGEVDGIGPVRLQKLRNLVRV